MSRSMKLLKIAGLLIIFSNLASASEKPPVSQAQMDEISARGKLLERYDQIAWHATDAVMALHPPSDAIRGFVVSFRNNNWICAFGRLNENKSGLIVAYETVNDAQNDVTAQRAFAVNQTDSGELFHEFLAMDTARTAFGPQTQAFNDAVLPAHDGQFYVYFYPGSTDSNVILMGGDVRYLVSADGQKILETRKLHASIRKEEVHPKGIQKVEMAFHTMVLSDVPEDTDVMYVLMRHPAVTELVASQKFIYQIDANGDIKFLGDTKKFLKSK